MANVLPSIREPNVDIYQTVAAVATAPPREGMSPCDVAPNYQVLEAKDANDNFDADALVGTYEDLDATFTYAIPGIEEGAVLDADSVEVWMKIGTSFQALDDPDHETELIDSEADSVVWNDPVYDLTDTSQDFALSGIPTTLQEIDVADYVVRMLGTDGESHDFPCYRSAATVLKLAVAPDGNVPPLQGSPPATADYTVVINPTKFTVNGAAIASSLRVNSEAALLLVPGAAPGSADVTFTASTNYPGDDGNDITVTVTTAASPLTVTVTNLDIVVKLETGVSTGTDVVDAVNIPGSQAAYLVTASVGATPGALAGTKSKTNLAGGSHILFTAPTAGVAGDVKRICYFNAGGTHVLELGLVGNDLTITLATTAGVETSTDQDIADAITEPTDPAYDPLVAAWITAAASGGTGIPIESLLATFTNLDGGFDANSLTLDANLIGTADVPANIYTGYRALRLKYTALASQQLTGNDPMLASASDLETLETLVGPFTTENPLGLMMYLTYLNNPGGTVFGLGVDEVSDSYPDGINAAWQRAADFLSTQNPCYIAVGSQRDTVHAIWQAHSDLMNGSETVPAVLERFIFVNKELPTWTPDDLLGNGDEIDKGIGAKEMTGDENFEALGVEDGDILVLDGYTTGSNFTLQDGTLGYTIASASDYTLTMDEALDPGGPVAWWIYRPGRALVMPSEKTLLAQTINAINALIARRQIASTFPDNATVSIDGTLYSVEGFYRDAAQIGQCAAQSVAKSKLRQSLVGIEGLRYSSEYFSATQLDIIQGGGTWVYFVPVQGGPVITRHSLTTDTTNVLTRNPTCVWAAIKFCRLVRVMVKKTLGGNITQALLDEVASKINSVGRFMVEAGEMAGFSVDRIEQGDGTTLDYDCILVEGSIAPLIPNNNIAFYLTVTVG